MVCCGRPSGRARIGTLNASYKTLQTTVAVVLRGERGLEPNIGKGYILRYWVAVVLRGERGLERKPWKPIRQLLSLRSSFGASEDWNPSFIVASKTASKLRNKVAVVLRGDQGLEPSHADTKLSLRLRSSFGAIKDWNVVVGQNLL